METEKHTALKKIATLNAGLVVQVVMIDDADYVIPLATYNIDLGELEDLIDVVRMETFVEETLVGIKRWIAKFPDAVVLYGRTENDLYTRDHISEYQSTLDVIATQISKSSSMLDEFIDNIEDEDIYDICHVSRWKPRGMKKMDTDRLCDVLGDFSSLLDAKTHRAHELLSDVDVIDALIRE